MVFNGIIGGDGFFVVLMVVVGVLVILVVFGLIVGD